MKFQAHVPVGSAREEEAAVHLWRSTHQRKQYRGCRIAKSADSFTHANQSCDTHNEDKLKVSWR